MQPHRKAANSWNCDLGSMSRNEVLFQVNAFGKNSYPFHCPVIKLATLDRMQVVEQGLCTHLITQLNFVVTATIGTLSPAKLLGSDFDFILNIHSDYRINIVVYIHLLIKVVIRPDFDVNRGRDNYLILQIFKYVLVCFF